ncbi:hypothetical protein M5099_05070 [Neisseria meningitidis]|nr:hypothetical protein [Neisseria meningitidis]
MYCLRLRRLVLIFVNPLYVFDGVQSLFLNGGWNGEYKPCAGAGTL